MKRKNVLLPIYLLALLVLGLSSSVFAQEKESSATLEETMEWLGSKLIDPNYMNRIHLDGKDSFRGSYGDPNFFFPMFYTTVKDYNSKYKIDGCTLTISIQIDLESGSSDKKQIITLPISEIDRFTLQKNGYGLEMSTTKSSKKILWRQEVFPLPNVKYSPPLEAMEGKFSQIEFELKKDSDRFERAFKHAIKLCGGKVDPF
jgi:hypothetical protein